MLVNGLKLAPYSNILGEYPGVSKDIHPSKYLGSSTYHISSAATAVSALRAAPGPLGSLLRAHPWAKTP